MPEHTARVVALHTAGVEVCARRTAGCVRCQNGVGCGGGIVAALLQRKTQTLIAAPGTEAVRVGDWVTLRLPGQVLLQAAALAYLVPLAGMFIALVVATLLLPAASDAAMALVALAGLAGGAWTGRRIVRHGRRWRPIVAARVVAAPEGET